jgi:LuxR family transcriptional regulator of csgAB operon
MIAKTSSGDKELAQLTDKVIHIIGPRRFQNGLMIFFLEREIGARCIEGEDVHHAPNIGDKDINQSKLILLDCLERDPDAYLVELESGGEKILYRHLVALFNVSRDLGIEEKALKRGVRGFFYEQEPLERFTKGVQAIFDGELWVSRGIMTKTILENRGKDIILKKDETILTPRESEILTMVAVGAKNEEIADELFISSNTVRTHIYNIFKKIDVPNRLQAALWAAKNL